MPSGSFIHNNTDFEIKGIIYSTIMVILKHYSFTSSSDLHEMQIIKQHSTDLWLRQQLFVLLFLMDIRWSLAHKAKLSNDLETY